MRSVIGQCKAYGLLIPAQKDEGRVADHAHSTHTRKNTGAAQHKTERSKCTYCEMTVDTERPNEKSLPLLAVKYTVPASSSDIEEKLWPPAGSEPDQMS